MKLVERDAHIEALNSLLDRVSSGTGCIALVCGEAGIGKTSLIQQFADQQRKAARVLWGGCEVLFTPHPLAPLYDVARQAGGEFSAAIAAAGNRGAIFNVTIDQLMRGPSPTILIFDDVHWADETTLDLIKFLGRRVQRLGVMLIISFRDDELGTQHPLRSVIGDLPPRSVYRLQVPALTETAVAALAQAAGRQSQLLYEITGGNPFFVTEVIAVSDDQLPPTVRDAVMARIARLPKIARTVADLTSLTPGKTERWLLEKTVAADGQALQECIAIGMVVLADGSLAFRHELARRAVEASVPLPTRQDLHALILKTLLEQPESDVSTARLVHHANGAGDSDAVLRFAPVAAAQAAALDEHREAAAHYATALRHAASLANERKAELLDRRSYECYLTDQISAAISAREASLRLWRMVGDRRQEGDNLRWHSRLSWVNGQTAAAEQYATQAIEVLESLPHGRELAMAYSNRAQLHMLAGDIEATLLWGAKALALASELNDQEVEIHALNNVGTAKVCSLDPSGRMDLERSLALALAGGFEEHAARAIVNLASCAVNLREYDRAQHYFDRGLAYCEEHHFDTLERHLAAYSADVHLAQGDWHHATEWAEAVLRHAGVAPTTKIPALVVLARVRARRGDPGIQASLDEAHALAVSTGEINRIGLVAAARAEVAWLRGDHDAVIAEASTAYELASRKRRAWIHGELAFWLWRVGQITNAPEGIAAPFALQIAGDWQAAASAWEQIGCPYEQATALADSASERALREALAIFERLEAGPMAAIVRRKLRASGIRGIPRGAQERTRQNPRGLTNRELKVLTLLVAGHRNADIARQLFVSERTVDHHVSAILSKLEVRSRGEAAAAATKLGLGRPETAEPAAKQ